MRTPTRKPGQYAHLKPDPHLSEEKFNELKNKLERLKNFSHPHAVAEVKRLAEMGDFSENAAYQMAKGRLRGINQRILNINDHLKSAIIIKPIKDAKIIQLGNKITVKIGDKQKTYIILGSTETDPTRGIISHNSPIGSALIGKRIGDKVEVELKNKTIKYKIIKIDHNET